LYELQFWMYIFDVFNFFFEVTQRVTFLIEWVNSKKKQKWTACFLVQKSKTENSKLNLLSFMCRYFAVHNMQFHTNWTHHCLHYFCLLLVILLRAGVKNSRASKVGVFGWFFILFFRIGELLSLSWAHPPKNYGA
jgi:hypothetical protein